MLGSLREFKGHRGKDSVGVGAMCAVRVGVEVPYTMTTPQQSADTRAWQGKKILRGKK